ncbi:MAG: glycosyltransferase family 4 protein [Clostridia bacterium]|nr:glycosyltransferase family 4 protein [Clostridia bacterium]
MKILFCISCLSYGGAEKNLRIVANHMAEKGHTVTVCSFGSQPCVQPLLEGVKVVYMPEYRKKGVKRLQQISFLRKLMKSEGIDITVSFLCFPNFISIIAGKLAHVPVIVSERGDPYQFTSKVMRAMYAAYRHAAGAVFQTEMAKEYFHPSLQAKSAVIANPVELKDETLFADPANAERSIAYSARFELVQKRQDIMLDAFQIVLERHPGYKLKFFGDGPDEEKMKRYAEELGISDSVVFCGRSDNILKDISQSSMFVLSSDYEGIPNSLLEAMSLGLPCVSTDCSPGGARMLIEDGVNGLIVPRGDASALAAAICRMIEDEALALSCGKNAISVRERFALPVILAAWEEYILKIAEGSEK